MDNFEFANRIVELRKQKGLSQKELGDMLGVSNKAVSKWENGESMPKTTTMLKLAELMEIDGNELIGFEVKERIKPEGNSEIDRLKTENALLSSRLNKIDKRRKRALAAVAVICIIGIIISGIIAFFLAPKNDDYSGIKDAGEAKTKIIFADETFVPPNEFEQYIIGKFADELYFCDEKYATYYGKDGTDRKVLIECEDSTDIVKLTVGRKDYYYLKKNEEKQSSILCSAEELYLVNRTITRPEDYYDSLYDYENYSGADSKTERLFFEFYENKGAPVDKKITENFLGNKPRAALISLDYNHYGISDFVAIGEFFKDNKGNAYFYDYVTTSSYFVGKELNRNVYLN